MEYVVWELFGYCRSVWKAWCVLWRLSSCVETEVLMWRLCGVLDLCVCCRVARRVVGAHGVFRSCVEVCGECGGYGVVERLCCMEGLFSYGGCGTLQIFLKFCRSSWCCWGSVVLLSGDMWRL